MLSLTILIILAIDNMKNSKENDFSFKQKKNEQITEITLEDESFLDLTAFKSKDLIKYGLIPEFVGRLPVVGTLHELDKPALIQILTQPRNAITRQYQKLFEYENVKLRFTDDALEAIAESALARKIGARGLRMIIEDLMLDLMYSVPGQKKVREVVVTRDVVEAKDKSITFIEKAG